MVTLVDAPMTPPPDAAPRLEPALPAPLDVKFHASARPVAAVMVKLPPLSREIASMTNLVPELEDVVTVTLGVSLLPVCVAVASTGVELIVVTPLSEVHPTTTVFGSPLIVSVPSILVPVDGFNSQKFCDLYRLPETELFAGSAAGVIAKPLNDTPEIV